MERHTTLGEFIVQNQKDFPYAKGELTALLSAIRLAGKMVNQEINKAGLAEIRGKAGKENVQGEILKEESLPEDNEISLEELENQEKIEESSSELDKPETSDNN